MISLMNNTTPQDTGGLFKLLELLSNPVAVERRLSEIVREKQDAQKLLEDAVAAQEAAQAAKADIQKRVAELDTREEAVTQREHVVTQRERRWQEFKQELGGKIAKIAAGA